MANATQNNPINHFLIAEYTQEHEERYGIPDDFAMNAVCRVDHKAAQALKPRQIGF